MNRAERCDDPQTGSVAIPREENGVRSRRAPSQVFPSGNLSKVGRLADNQITVELP